MMHTDVNGFSFMEIKIATKENIADILRIEQICFSTPWTEQGIAESIDNSNTYLYIATVDDSVAGYMGVQIFSGEGYVTNVATLPEYRRQGVAKALISEVLKHDMEFLTLEVRESNITAINLYNSLGFEVVGKRPRFYREPTEDAVLMTKFGENNG